MRNIKQDILGNLKAQLNATNNFLLRIEDSYHRGYTIPDHEKRLGSHASNIAVQMNSAWGTLHSAQTIIFSSSQAEYFMVEDGNFLSYLKCDPPFHTSFFQFTHPILLDIQDGFVPEPLIGFTYCTQTVTAEDIVATQHLADERAKMGIPILGILDFTPGEIIGHAILIFQDYKVQRMSWRINERKPLESAYKYPLSKPEWQKVCHMILGCLGYLNCENIFLERQEGASEKINRKREKEGKRVLEPYYLCRITGYQYETVATGEGTKHGHRYDVRGHFRHYRKWGKTTWIPAHQRGLANELYIPKTYVVEKGRKKI